MLIGLWIFLLFLLQSSLVAMPCSNLNDKSCWSVTNKSRTHVQIICKTSGDKGPKTVFDTGVLKHKKSFSRQFPKRCNDGQGYGHESVTCSLIREKSLPRFIHFSHTGYGSLVQFLIKKSVGFEAIIKDYWNQKKWTYYFDGISI